MHSARIAAPLLSLLLLFGFLAREGPSREPRGTAPRAVERYLEAESAWNFRRVQLALAAGRVTQFDRPALFPRGGDVVDPPVFVAAVAGAAHLTLGTEATDASLVPTGEERLARWLRHLGPLLGLFFILVAHRATARIGGTSGRARALLAAVQVAAGAPFILAMSQGRLPLGVFSALLSGLGLSIVAPLFRRDGPAIDRLQSALLGGLVLGLGLATSPLGAAAAFPVVLLLWVELFAVADGEERRSRARESLLLSVTMACIAALPALGGPWQPPAPDGPVARLARIFPLLVMASALPAVLAFWPPVSRRLEARGVARRVGIVALVVAASLGLLLLPGLPAPRMYSWPLAWSVLHLIGFVCCLRDLRGGGLRLWCFAFPVAIVAASLDPRGAVFVGLVGAVLLAASVWPEGRGTRRWLLAVTAALLVADLATSFLSRPAEAERRAGQGSVVRALRELRRTTPSAGPWNASRAVSAWCIAAPPGLAPAVLLHSRRPVLEATGRVVGKPSTRNTEDLFLARDEAELTELARAHGVRLLCLRPVDLEDLQARLGAPLPFLEALLRDDELGIPRDLLAPFDDRGRAALVIVHFE